MKTGAGASSPAAARSDANCEGRIQRLCEGDGRRTPWDKIWYQYTLVLPNMTGFEGTQEEALALWEQYNGIGTGEWRIDVTVDVYTLWGTVCDCEDGEDVQLTISYIEYEVNMAKVMPPDSTE